MAGPAGGGCRRPAAAATRPTSDRVREALFSSVESWCGTLSGLRVLDLYAGSGAVGLEAWSRGAGVVTLVESDRRTAALVSANARSLGFARAEVLAASVSSVLARRPSAPYDLVFLDPPYPSTTRASRPTSPRWWRTTGWSRALSSSSSGPCAAWSRPGRTASLDRRRPYGETVLWYGHAAQPDDPSGGPLDDQE